MLLLVHTGIINGRAVYQHMHAEKSCARFAASSKTVALGTFSSVGKGPTSGQQWHCGFLSLACCTHMLSSHILTFTIHPFDGFGNDLHQTCLVWALGFGNV